MQTIARTFLRGLLAFLPVFLTVYAVYYFGAWLNRQTSMLLASLWPELPVIPGLGILIGAAGIFVLGLLVSSRLTSWIYRLVETPLRRLPIIKALYTALKQLTDFLSPKAGEGAGQVVRIEHPDCAAVMVGILMREDVEDLDLGAGSGDLLAVYLPMSYQIGGFTVFVPRSWVHRLDMPVEKALRETLTGWLAGKSG